MTSSSAADDADERTEAEAGRSGETTRRMGHDGERETEKV